MDYKENNFNSPSIALGQNHKTNFKDSDSDHMFKNVWDRFFSTPISNQLPFNFIGQVKTYLKSQILNAKKAIKKLFKKAVSKVQSISNPSTQLSIIF